MSAQPETATSSGFAGTDQMAVRKAIAGGVRRAARRSAGSRVHLRLAVDAEGPARTRAAPRRDHDPGDVRAHVHLPVRRRDRGSTGEYLDYILPGILVMSVLFTTVYSGVALNTDLTRGVVDRFRSLPIWRPAPLVGALLGDSVRYLVAVIATIVISVNLIVDMLYGVINPRIRHA